LYGDFFNNAALFFLVERACGHCLVLVDSGEHNCSSGRFICMALARCHTTEKNALCPRQGSSVLRPSLLQWFSTHSKGEVMKTQHRKAALNWIYCLMAALVLSLTAHDPASAQDKIRVGVGVDPSYTTWWVAQDKGFFAKYGITAELTQFPSGAEIADGVMAGELDFGASGTATWMPRFVRSDNLRLVATQATSTDNFKMAALTSLKTLADVKGKKLGTVQGSTTDYLWALVAKKLNVPESELGITPVPPPELPAALDRGDIQAFFVWEPWPTKAVQISGKDKVHILASSGDVGYFQSFSIVGNKNFIQSKPDVTVRMLAAMRDASAFMKTNRAEAVKITAARNKVPLDIAEYIMGLYNFDIAFGDTIVSGAKVEEAWMRGKERLKGQPINWEKVVDRSYFDKSASVKK
jgi:NitT/TauT family transport system substrate-binding protein